MPRSTPEPPVILIGMHRGGTSMLAELLESLGVFVGHKLQPGHHEAVFFIDLNDWVLEQNGGGWDNPQAIRYLLDDPETRRVAVDYLELSMRSPRAMSFLGPKRYARLRDVRRIDEPWGWKDPRSTYTLPLWLEVFPDARVLHIFRHGVDVAASLTTRRNRLVARSREEFHKNRWRYLVVPRRAPVAPGLRFTSYDAGLDLWDRYTTEATRHVAELGERALEICYEDLLADPRTVMSEVSEFCGVTLPPRGGPDDLLAEIDADRAFAFRNDDELRAVADQHRELLARHGYGPDGRLGATETDTGQVGASRCDR